ncbi:hypothetical protein [Roseateles sp. LYH14W]|uniref:SPOR domain-containing protein n=1 Tax=Pelomonas parva TaxID=3299032 RepID=A0ABW7FAC4_9BURK
MNTSQTDDRGEDAQAEAFFEALAGRGKSHDGAAVLRATILAESQALRSAHAASPHAASRDAQTFALLLKDGVFAEPRAARAAVPPRATLSKAARWRERMDRLFAIRWFSPAIATFAAVACLFVIMPGQPSDPANPDEVLRGGAQDTMVVADPEAFAQSVLTELRAAGADARLLQINDRSWMLSVTVPPDRTEAATAVLQRKGWRDIARFPVDLTITQR